MPGNYTRKGRMTRRRYSSTAKKNSRYIKKAKSSYAQQKQLLSIQRQLTATKSKLKDRAQWTQWSLPLEPASQGSSIDLNDGEFYVVGLVRPAAMTGIFQSTLAGGTQPLAALQSNIAYYKSFDIQMLFSPKNSLTALTPRIVRVFVVSLKKETAQDTLQGTGGMNTAGLNGATAGVYTYITNSDGGLPTLVKLNPAAFKIHAYREFTVANIMQETADPTGDTDTALTNTFNQVKRVRIKMRTNTKVKPPQGTWREMTEPEIMPLDRKYLIVHVGGWGADADNQIHMDTNIVCNLRETN
ncbi:MAG: hypothetical protein [Circular genetic element sp.]|nr:MAG: hypothetical protein [Circular genetic element sp.]